MNANTTTPGVKQHTPSAGFITGNSGLSTGASVTTGIRKPTYAEVVKAICPPAQSLISAPAGQALTQTNSHKPVSSPNINQKETGVHVGITRAPALTKKCEDVIADATKNDKNKEIKSDKKKPKSELALIFEKQNKPIVLSGGKKPQKKTDWFSDIKIVDGPQLNNHNLQPGPQIIEVSPDKPPIKYQLVEIAQKEHKKKKENKDDNKKPTSNDASKKANLGWATKKPIKKWSGDTNFNHPDVYLKRRPKGDVNPYNVLSGHGGWNRNLGYVIVPKGTDVTVFAKHGGSISDRLGNAIEHGEFNTLRNVFNKTYKQGQKIPNYVLSEPVGLNIEGQPTLTRHDVLLSELLEKNLGHVLWAACCSATGEKFSDYSFDVTGAHKD